MELHRGGFPGLAASTIPDETAVTLAGTGERAVIPAADTDVEPFGFVNVGGAEGQAVTVYELGDVVEVTAAASLGHGANVGVAAGSPGLAPVAAASGTANYRVGKALQAASAGDRFSVYVSPKQLGGLA